MLRIGAWVCLLSLWPAAAPADLFRVHVETGKRQTRSGDGVGYSLYIPAADPDLPAPPWPAVVLLHGFGRNHRYHAKNAYYMAQRGIVVLTPDMTSLAPGRPAQVRNIANLTDHVLWLKERAEDEQDELRGLVDPNRIGLAGHSAGGAVALEAAVRAQEQAIPIGALVLLDAVPWDRTVDRATELRPLPLVSLRSEPGICNLQGKVVDLLNHLSFSAEDVLVVGAHHCDAENPSSRLCALVCWGRDGKGQRLYQRLMALFFQDAFGAHNGEEAWATYDEVLLGLEHQRAVRRVRTRATEGQPVPGVGARPCPELGRPPVF